MLEEMLKGSSWIEKLARLYQTDGRRHARLRAEFTGALSGPFGTVHVAGIDLNRDGAGVQSSQELPEGTLVFLRIADVGLMGFAHVRHCSPRPGEGYFLGLEFREGLTGSASTIPKLGSPGAMPARRPRSGTKPRCSAMRGRRQ